MNTIGKDIISYVESIGCGTFGVDLFYGRVPDSKKTVTNLWWIESNGSAVDRHNVTGEDTLSYRFSLYYRNTRVEYVEEKIYQATRSILASHCYNLNNHRTIDIEYITSTPGSFFDEENRVYGVVSFSATVYDIIS